MLLKIGRIFGRGEWIRTTGLLVPNQALYQAEPRPEVAIISRQMPVIPWSKQFDRSTDIPQTATLIDSI